MFSVIFKPGYQAFSGAFSQSIGKIERSTKFNNAAFEFEDAAGSGRAVEGGTAAFGNLSKAADYGLDSYSTLQKTLNGTGLEAHHIVEKRLAGTLGISKSDSMISVAVTKTEHQVFTNKWRELIPYGTDYDLLSPNYIMGAAQKVYNNCADLLEAAQTTIFNITK